MTVIWLLMPALVLFAALRYVARAAAKHLPGERPSIDDDAIRRIIEEGRLTTQTEDPLDMDEAAREEEDFWSESWDEPDEYRV